MNWNMLGKEDVVENRMLGKFRLDWNIIWVSWDIGYMVEHAWSFRILFGMPGYTLEHILNILEYFVGICFGHIKILLGTTIEIIQIL